MIPLVFKPLSLDHLNLLHKWMQQPHVHQWWSDGKSWSFNDIREKYTPYTLGYKIEQGEKKLIFPFVIEFENRPVGFIQYYSAFDFEREGFCVKEIWKDQNQSLAAIDFYIGEPDCIGKGLAPKALTSFLQQYVFNHFDVCLVDPKKNNKAAIKCYAKAGFSTLQDLDSCIIMIAHREETKNPLIYSAMKKIFFIIGASGSGKTTVVKEIERMTLPNFKTIYFDSIGVPSLEEMTLHV